MLENLLWAVLAPLCVAAHDAPSAAHAASPGFLDLGQLDAPPAELAPPAEPAQAQRSSAASAAAASAQPRYWVSVGLWKIDSEVDTGFDEGDSDDAVSVELGLYNWTSAEMGLGLEVAYQKSSYTIDTGGLNDEDVDATRIMAGVRLADTQATERWLYWAHGGLLYRKDESASAGDADGLGFYAGLGVEFRPVPMLGIGPEVFYSQAESFDAREWQFGLKATLHL